MLLTGSVLASGSLNLPGIYIKLSHRISECKHNWTVLALHNMPHDSG